MIRRDPSPVFHPAAGHRARCAGGAGFDVRRVYCSEFFRAVEIDRGRNLVGGGPVRVGFQELDTLSGAFDRFSACPDRAGDHLPIDVHIGIPAGAEDFPARGGGDVAGSGNMGFLESGALPGLGRAAVAADPAVVRLLRHMFTARIKAAAGIAD